MNSSTGYTIEGVGPSGRNAARRASGGLAWPLWALGAIALMLLGLNLWLWAGASGRASAAVDRVADDAQKWRDSWNQAAPAPTKGKKKGKKSAGAAVVPGADVVGPLPDGRKVPVADLETQSDGLEKTLGGYQPKGIYIVIDTANNHLYLKNGEEVILDARCSTGSYSKLESPDGRTWFFHTPRGRFSVQTKKKDPIWVKPDWAFVETNDPIPGATAQERYEPYVMGDYALGFGNGYYIHGTLYSRMLGQSVTHGCVRLGDADLEQVFKTAEVGTPIFIY